VTTSVLSQTSGRISSTSKAVLSTLLYFDIFHHPLTKGEIHEYLHYKNADSVEISRSITDLVEEGHVRHEDDFFFISGNPSTIIEKRIRGEIYSEKAIKMAKKYSRLIASFPFVRAVFISGSLSKGYMDDKSDIDYFIVTVPGRLWLCRTLLILFKKIFLFNSRKNFCLNYFVSEDNLGIPDRNIFTATELVSVIPTFNYFLYENFLSENNWTQTYLPNIPGRGEQHCVRPFNSFFKKGIQWLLRRKAGVFLDRFCYNLTFKFWRKKFSQLNDSDFNHRFRSSKKVSKHHPLGYQLKVLNMFNEKIKLFEIKNGVRLS
jgi:hypothetical protein